MTAFISAYVTCLSRISDYHRRASDVIGESVLGTKKLLLLAYTFFKRYKINYFKNK